jgi:hypothetical protein
MMNTTTAALAAARSTLVLVTDDALRAMAAEILDAASAGSTKGLVAPCMSLSDAITALPESTQRAALCAVYHAALSARYDVGVEHAHHTNNLKSSASYVAAALAA